jgi:hypothetical protein
VALSIKPLTGMGSKKAPARRPGLNVASDTVGRVAD